LVLQINNLYYPLHYPLGVGVYPLGPTYYP